MSNYIFSDPNEYDVHGTYEEMMNQFLETGSQDTQIYVPSQETESQNQLTQETESVIQPSTSRMPQNMHWTEACRRLLNELWDNKECKPFRYELFLIF